ncbi:MAG: methyltransferase domain-containing protein [Flavobacteriales bacterium]|nr:methyltransferase domain-containing protein [Flavobacteriales bacterium]
MAWYRTWFGTSYYKLLYGHRDQDDAHAWVRMILEKLKPAPVVDVLDMACGRGRHAHWFIEEGCHVTGIDISPESIADARKDVPGGAFVVHDIREPFAMERFDLVVCLFTSLGYFESPGDDQRALAAAAAALRPGGWFVLDFMNSSMVVRDLVSEECLESGGVRFTISRCMERGQIVKRIAAEDQGEVHRFEERVTALMPSQLESLVLAAGLVIRDLTDGPVPTPFDNARSKRLVIWAQRPAA